MENTVVYENPIPVEEPVLKTMCYSISEIELILGISTAEDRERDKAQEEMGYTMPEIAKMLLISRKEVYNLLASPKCAGVFEYFTVAEKKRITKESFETWY